MDRIPSDAPDCPIPKPNIPDNELLGCIGRGGYGDVWLARGVAQTYRAIKVIYRGRFDDARPFERELAGIRKFDPLSRANEGLVDVLHVSQQEGYFYYVMELADDTVTGQEISPERYTPKTLSHVLSKRSRLPFDESLEIGMTLSKGLSFLHQHGLVHRDVKPSNVIFVNGQPKLADIGLIADMKDPRSFVGTEGYIPPEGPGTPQADVYSLGKVLYETSTGEDRHRFPTLPPDIDQWPNGDQFRELNEILLKACQNDARARYQTADEMYGDLGGLLNGRSIRRLRALERRWAQFKRVAFAGLALVALCGILGYEYLRESNRRRQERARTIGRDIAQGIQKMESGELIQSLPPLIRALAQDDAHNEQLHRTRISAILDQAPKLLQLWSHESEAKDGQFSPDGRFVVISTRHGYAHVMDAKSGVEVARPFGLPSTMETACFSPDGTLVLIANQNNHRTATLWDWKSGERRLTLPHPKNVLSARFNHKGDEVVTACADQVARVWNVKTGQVRLPLTNHTGAVRFAGFSPNDDRIVTAGTDNLVLLWRASDGQLLGEPLKHRNWVVHASFSPDGTKLATACSDHNAYVWDLNDRKQVMPGLYHRDGISSVEFSPDGRLLLTASWDMTVRIWLTASGRPFLPNHILPHSGRVLRAAFAPDGHRVMSSCADGTSRIWDIAGTAASSKTVGGSLCENGSHWLTQTNGSVQVIEAKSGKLRINGAEHFLESTLNHNGRFMLAVTRSSNDLGDRTLSLFRTDTGQRVSSLAHFSNELAFVRLSDDGQRLITWAGRVLQVFDRSSGTNFASFVHGQRISNAVFAPSGNEVLILGGTEGRFFDLISKQPRLGPLKHAVPLAHAEYSLDGRLVVTACADSQFTPCSAQVWNAATGLPMGAPINHGDGVLYASFDPLGHRVVSAGEDFTALISELDGRGPPKQLAHNRQVLMACFSPSGKRVLTIDQNQFARVWDADSGEPITPPLPHHAKISRGQFLDEQTIATTDQNKTWVWELPGNDHCSSELALLAKILNGDLSTSSGSRSKQQDKWLQNWHSLKSSYPEQFEVSNAELALWHEQQLKAAELEGDDRAAFFHREQARHIAEGSQQNP